MAEKSNKPADHPETMAERRARMRNDWNNLIEEIIEDGQQQGIFDNLPGKGKPLNLKKNPYGQEMELAHKLLKDNDLQPAWIAHRKTLLEQVDRLRQEMRTSWERHQRDYLASPGEGQRSALVVSWADACDAWDAQILALNKQINDFNLKRVIDRTELFKLNLDEELNRCGAPRWLRALDA
jgi:hypothetical protein